MTRIKVMSKRTLKSTIQRALRPASSNWMQEWIRLSEGDDEATVVSGMPAAAVKPLYSELFTWGPDWRLAQNFTEQVYFPRPVGSVTTLFFALADLGTGKALNSTKKGWVGHAEFYPWDEHVEKTYELLGAQRCPIAIFSPNDSYKDGVHVMERFLGMQRVISTGEAKALAGYVPHVNNILDLVGMEPLAGVFAMQNTHENKKKTSLASNLFKRKV